MADPSSYTYPSPLEGWEGLPPLPDEKTADGKSYFNPPTGKLSPSYDAFIAPLDNGPRAGL
jgi:hypothetical protein